MEVRPASPQALKTLGLIELREGRGEAGKVLLLESLRLSAEIPAAEVALAEFEERSGDIQEALGRYRRLIDA